MVNVIIVDRNVDFPNLVKNRIELLGSDHVRIVGVLTDGADLEKMMDLTHADMIAVCANALDTRDDWNIPEVQHILKYTRRKNDIEKYPRHCILGVMNSDFFLTFLECYDKEPTGAGKQKDKTEKHHE